jgi:aspartate dehydrogenase
MLQAATTTPIKVGVGGLGAIGGAVTARLQEGMRGITLAAIADASRQFALDRARWLRCSAPLVELEELAERSDVVVECSTLADFKRVAQPVVQRGRTLIPLSVGGLLLYPEILELAIAHGARVLVPSGAMAGLDALRAAAEGVIHSVRLETRKPPKSFAGAPQMVELELTPEQITRPLRLFAGNARESARRFPANINVAAALALAGIGPERTEVEVWADPALTCNTHTVTIRSDSSDITISIQNKPSENPKTGRIAPQSVIATLRGLTGSLRIGA